MAPPAVLKRLSKALAPINAPIKLLYWRGYSLMVNKK
jgi:hypothetical protein